MRNILCDQELSYHDKIKRAIHEYYLYRLLMYITIVLIDKILARIFCSSQAIVPSSNATT